MICETIYDIHRYDAAQVLIDGKNIIIPLKRICSREDKQNPSLRPSLHQHQLLIG